MNKNLENLKISDNSLRNVQKQFGLPDNSTVIVDSIEQLRKSTPNIVIAQCINSIKFKLNNAKILELKKKQNYIMSISIYAQLEYDKYKFNKNGQPKKNLKPAKTKFIKIYRPYIGQDLDKKTLLVTRTGGIGDLLFIKPNLDFLKKKYPTCKILFASGDQYHSMLEEWDCIDEVLSLPFSDKIFYKCNYHLIFEGVIERTKEAQKINAYELFSRWMGLNLPKKYLRPVQPIVIEKVIEVEEILEKYFDFDTKSKKDKICTVQLKASSPIRTPHPKVWLPILKFIISRGYKIIIVDNPLLHNQLDKIIDTYFKEIKDSIINFTKYSKDISYAIALAGISDMVIGPDSSMVHIAESVSTKNFGIYGPFPGHVRLSTYKYNDWIDCQSECSPCFTHGHKPCIYGAQNGGCSPCYNNINMSEFIKKFKELEIK